MSNQQIENSYKYLLSRYDGSKRNKESGEEAVKRYMREHKKIWWFAWEVVGKETSIGDWLSHRAPARLSGLVKKGEVETRRIGKYSVYRLK